MLMIKLMIMIIMIIIHVVRIVVFLDFNVNIEIARTTRELAKYHACVIQR